MSFPVTVYQQLVEQMHQVFFVYSLREGRITYVNDAYELLLHGHCNQVNEELPGLLRQIHPDDKAYLAGCFAHLVWGEAMENIEARLIRDNGLVQWLCLSAHCVQENGETFLTGFAHDISSNKEYLENAHKYNMKKNSTLEILSHDLAGPLNLMHEVSARLGHKLEHYQNADLNELVRIIRTTCGESVDLIRDFVGHEFLESANIDLKRERTDLVHQTKIVVDNYREGERNVDKEFILRSNQPSIYIWMDINKFMQVINNLISNSIKFTPDGGRIELTLEEKEDHVLLTVTDNGIGIPEAFHPVLFDKFTKARRPGLRGEKSTGLGMSIIKTIVELHEGSIEFESAENQGTTFFIRLPLSLGE
ncbi:PAS domain S-box protein [Hymenobacter sp. BT175]|uniref:sensor histidine kinase n=1 Tax=Hymenobacter translucens TaxID=2886507 RepID=UPI001D0E07E8|nr:ATP-binding protein [Hymenobacter translucens]MCC2545941.1 PAS domain S-box protein [Hymenobacter translucens]